MTYLKHEELKTEIMHYGVRGMKWGVRKAQQGRDNIAKGKVRKGEKQLAKGLRAQEVVKVSDEMYKLAASRGSKTAQRILKKSGKTGVDAAMIYTEEQVMSNLLYGIIPAITTKRDITGRLSKEEFADFKKRGAVI